MNLKISKGIKIEYITNKKEKEERLFYAGAVSNDSGTVV